MSIMTISGRIVKRPGKLAGAGQIVKTAQIVRAMHRAKTRTSSAYRLTETGERIVEEGDDFLGMEDVLVMSEAARQAVANLDALVNRREDEFDRQVAELDEATGCTGDGVGQTLSDVCRRYSTVRDGNTLVMTGAFVGDYVLLDVETGEPDDPGPRCFQQGRRATLPNVIYELAAQLWLAKNPLGAGPGQEGKHAG